MHDSYLTMTHWFLILVNPISTLEWIYKRNHILRVMMQIWNSDSGEEFREGYEDADRFM